MTGRPLRQNERDILVALIHRAGLDRALSDPQALDAMCAVDLSDGGMGSIRFLPATSETARRFGRVACEVLYTDTDGVDVLISLLLDDRGDLFEIDMWKMDYSALKKYPIPDRFRAAAIQPLQRRP